MQEPLTQNKSSTGIECTNCGAGIRPDQQMQTENGEYGCDNCIEQCDICQDFYFTDKMEYDPYCGGVCQECMLADDYWQITTQKVLKDALRSLFDNTNTVLKHREKHIIKITEKLGYRVLAGEMLNDL